MTTTRAGAVIGPDLTVIGELRNGGQLDVLGTVVGTVVAERVIVHAGGRIVGKLDAEAADVNGLVDGRVRVRHLIRIGSGGVVQGDVRYGQLAMEPGGDLAADVRNVPPELGGDFELIVRRGRSVTITTDDLCATDEDDGADDLTYVATGFDGGVIGHTAAAEGSIESFTQADLAAGRIVFRHDGSDGGEAGFDVVVSDSAGNVSGRGRRVKVVVI